MGKQFIPIAVFILLNISVAMFFNKRFESIVVATIVASFTTSIAFQVVGLIITGYLDPFILIAFLYSLGIALIISFIVGVVFRYYRKLKKLNREV